jgi:mannose-6-phosphate isomerase-like protein (cupin superfamily)
MPYEGQTFVNARTGQRMTFVELRDETLRIDTVNPPAPVREPVHLHPRQESRAEVQSGALVFEIEGEQRTVGPGESVTIDAGVRHRFWNEGVGDAHAIQTFKPALDIASFFETFAALAAQGKLDAKGMPSPLQLAVMLPVFADEIRVPNPPWPLQRAFAAVAGPVARARGYQARIELAG